MPEVRNAIKVEAQMQKRMLRLTVIRDGVDAGYTEVPLNQASSFAAIILKVAKDAYEALGTPIPEKPKPESCAIISPSSLGLGPSPELGCEALIFFFGETALGMSIPPEAATMVGQQLLALGASGPHQ